MNANTDKLVTDLKSVVHDAEHLLQDTVEDASEKARAARERLVSALEEANRSCHKLQAKAIEGVKTADKVIRDHPYQSIGIALGIGLVAGHLLTRK